MGTGSDSEGAVPVIRRVKGRLSDNSDLVHRAMDRASRMADVEPDKRHVDGEHWVHSWRLPPPTSGEDVPPEDDPCQ